MLAGSFDGSIFETIEISIESLGDVVLTTSGLEDIVTVALPWVWSSQSRRGCADRAH